MSRGSVFAYHTADGRRCPHGDPHPGRRWMYSTRIAGRNAVRRGFATKKEADATLALLLAQVAVNEYVAPTSETVAIWAETWLASIRTTVAATTHANYAWFLRKHLLPTLGRKRLSDLTPEDLEAVYGQMVDAGRAGSVRTLHSTTRNMLGDAVRRKRLRSNPALIARPGKSQAKKLAVWSAAELGCFLDGIRGHRLEVLYTVYVATGCRRSEALAVTWDDLDLDLGRIRFARALVVVNGRPHMKESTKSDRARWVDVDGETTAALRTLAARQTDEFAVLDAVPQGGDLVFTTLTGEALHPTEVGKEFRRLAADRGLKRIRLHDLRHSHATALLRAGVPVTVVSQRLGHANPTVTMNVYSHVLPGDQADAAAIFRRLLQPDFTRTPTRPITAL